MGTVTLAARALLAVVFGIAGLSKLLARSESQATFREFGAGERLSRFAGLLLPPAELVVAVMVMIAGTARWAAIAAAALLVVFMAGIANALHRGRRPDCGCFGISRPAPISGSTLARNGALLAIAALVVVAGPGPGVDGWIGSRGPASLIALAIVALALVTVIHRSLRIGGTGDAALPTPTAAVTPSAGDPAPEFALSDASGSTITLSSLLEPGCPLVLVFASPGCGSCAQVFAEMGRWQSTFAERIRIAVIAAGAPEQTRQALEQYRLGDVLTGSAEDVRREYGVHGTPAAVVVAADGTIVASPVVGQDRIEDLIRLTLRQFDAIHDPWSQYPWNQTIPAT